MNSLLVKEGMAGKIQMKQEFFIRNSGS